MRKFKDRCGAALLEVIISIAILGLLTVPVSSGIMMSLHINEKSDDVMQARLAVSSAVETIMAVGVETYKPENADSFTLNGTKIKVHGLSDGYWSITVSCPVGNAENSADSISVDTYVRSSAVRTSEPVTGQAGG